MSEQDNIIYLTDEDGIETAFEFLDLIEYCGKEYVVLLPCDEEADEVVILELEKSENEDEDMESYASVDDERILTAVFEMFKERAKDDFDFVD